MRFPALGAAASVLATGVLSMVLPAPATADVFDGCDAVRPWSDACLPFDSDGDGHVDQRATVTTPVAGAVPAGSTVPVTVTGVDLVRPAVVGIYNLGPTDYPPEPAQLVATATIAPGALTTTVDVPVGTTLGDRRIMAYLDTWEIDGLYVQESFEVTVAALPSSLTSDLPPGRIVKVNAKSQAVTGTVSGGARPVDLQMRAKDGSWVTVARTTSAANGSYVVPVPTFWVGNHTYRAFAPQHGVLGAGETSRTGSLKVTRAYKPRGSTAHALLRGDARWNACEPIRYSVNTARLPRWGLKEIRYSLREVSAATGLRFTKVAGTDHVPYARREKPFPDHADLVFAFSDPRTVPGLAGSTIGLGGAQWSGSTVTRGGVVIDVAQRASNAQVWRQIMLHEVGHAIGLGHVGDRKQVMFPMSNGSLSRYAKGDLRGLAAVGAGAGPCTGTEEDSYLRNARSPYGAPDEPVHEVVLP